MNDIINLKYLFKYCKISTFIFLFIFYINPIKLLAEGGSNDPQVTITATKTVTEGNSGTKDVTLTVSINECPALLPVKIKYNTSNGTANSGSDYNYASGTITFDTDSIWGMISCQKSYNITLKVKGDTDVEPNENFYVQLSDNGTSNSQKYHWGNQRATVIIKNDDEAKSADLAISVTNDATNKVNVGDIVTYTIVAKNNGPDSADFYVWDDIPDEMDFVSVSDNRNNFECAYNSSDGQIVCNGDRVFSNGESVTLIVKTKVKNNNQDVLKSYVGVESDDSPKINDPISSNNKAVSDVYMNLVDLGVKKLVKAKNGQYVLRATDYNIGDNIEYKITFGNYNDGTTRIDLEDTLPNELKLLSVNIVSAPNNYSCSANTFRNKVTCSGSHLFRNGEEVVLKVQAQALDKGRIYNEADVSSADGVNDSDPGDNSSYAIVDIGLQDEAIDASKTVSPPPEAEHTVGDIVTFTINGRNIGSRAQIKIQDWLGKYGSTAGAFEYLSHQVNNGNIYCSVSGSGNDRSVLCKSYMPLPDNATFSIDIKVKLKKTGNVCNRVHIYKDINGYLELSNPQVCFDVNKPKYSPVLNADHFYVRLNQNDSIDLKDHTTDNDTPKDKLIYKIVSGSLPDGYSMTNDGTISGIYTDDSGTFPKDFNITVKVTDDDGLSDTDSFIITVDGALINAEDNYYEIPANGTLNGNLITDSGSSGSHYFGSDEGDSLTVVQLIKKSSDHGTLTYNSDGSFTYKAGSVKENVKYEYHIKDKYGQIDYAMLYIEVQKQDINATDDNIQVAKNTPIYANVFSDNGNGVDVGDDIKVVSYTQAAFGHITITENGNLVYTPNINYVGKDTSHYTIKDKYGQTDTATIQFNVGTIHKETYKDFYLVNPPETRNLIGNYVTIGNSVECITDKRGTDNEDDSFNGVCQNNRELSNNDYMVKYIDIDNSDATWNSSSATFQLPDSFLKSNDGKGIVWAGLFWQGGINNVPGFKQRRVVNLMGFTSPQTIDVVAPILPIDFFVSNTDKVLINIDNLNSGYKEVTADTFYYDLTFDTLGGYYAAYANITSILQDANLTKGKHTITVANIVTNEGREPNVGNYGGWSLVVIYKENINGKPRNISVYNGFQSIGFGGSTNIPSKEIKISGFKLPKDGEVDSTISVFAGEGEKKYGGNNVVYDRMYIKDINTDSIYNMPSSSPNNIFNASIENIERNSGNNNNLLNTNGIDVDSYDVSSIMKNIRDNKKDTNSVKIGIVSKDDDTTNGDDSDYIVASMIAYSTQLYAPKMCYDYSIRLGEYIDVPSADRNFTVTDLDNEPLQLKIMLRSQEADFDLIESKLSTQFNPDNIFDYKQGYSKYSPPNTNVYLDAIETDAVKGEIAIGSNPTTDGGTIGVKETTYSKLYYDFIKPTFSGKFDINVDAKISFDGINKVPYKLSTSLPKNSVFYIGRCDTNPVYNPVYGQFNIERGDSKFNQPDAKRYSLYTQVVGVPYQISIASYKKDSNGNYNEKNPINATVELELIDAGTYDNNSSAGFDSVCSDPDTHTSYGKFVKFNNKSRVKLKVPDDFTPINGKETYPKNLALKNAAFRVWVLTKKSGNNNVIVDNNCSSQYDSICFDKIYVKNYKGVDTHCSIQCTNSIGSSCYKCLKKFYAIPICSRDNFAIRPESYRIAINDNNETNSNSVHNITINNSSNNVNLSAGYMYKLDINATKYNDNINKTDGYYFYTVGDENIKKAIAKFNDKITCEDKNDHELNIHILNGQTVGYESLTKNNTTPQNGLIINNSGKYKLHIEDKEWTLVDQKGYSNKTFPNIDDCNENNSIINIGLNAKKGCNITSDLNPKYYDLNVNMHPYTFDISSVSVNPNPNSSVNYLYINDLNYTTEQIKNGKTMAIKIDGNIKALGKNRAVLSNYTKNCSANDLNIKISYKTLKEGNISQIRDDSNNIIEPNYSLYVPNIDTNVNVNSIDVNTSKLNINFTKNYFDDTNDTSVSITKGVAHFNLYYNYKREYNTPINPFTIHFGIFNVNASLDKSSVDLVNNHIPNITKKDFNKDLTFYYAKARSKSDFYDDIYDDSIKTPIIVTLFCNDTLEYCENYGIDITKMQTSEYDWWIAKNHTSTDGKVDLKVTQGHATVAPSLIDSFTDGVNKNVTVKINNGQSRPHMVKIAPTNNMKTNYPWLLFNKFENKAPEYLYRVKFVNTPSAWSGKGKTGHTIDVKAGGRKNKKVDW